MIDRYKPLTNTITHNERSLLVQLNQDERNLIQLMKKNKGVNVSEEFNQLRGKKLINEDLSLTETAEVVSTLLKVVSRL